LKLIILFSTSSLELLKNIRLLPSLILTNDWLSCSAAYAKNWFDYNKLFKNTTFIHVIHDLSEKNQGFFFLFSFF
jgi:hypothetical protein